MDKYKETLKTVLYGLEAIRANAEYQINLIQKQLEEPVEVPAKAIAEPQDSTILGIDTLGRIIRKRNLSPEVRAKKQKIMLDIRDRRLQDKEELKRLRAEIAASK